MKIKTIIFILIILVLTTGSLTIWFAHVDDSVERERNAIKLLIEEKQVFLSHIEHFAEYPKILLILYSETGYFEIEYTDTPDEKDTAKWIFKRLILDLNKQKYYLQNGNIFSSLEEALKIIDFDQKELIYWKEFFEKYNLYAIDTAIHIKYVLLTFNRFHIIPHGLLYVLPDGEEDMRYFLAEIPGRLRGRKTAVYDIVTHIEGRWFYFEGPD